MKKRNKYQSGSMAKINSDKMPILIDPGPHAGGMPDLGSEGTAFMPKPAKPKGISNNPEPRPMTPPVAVMEPAKAKPRPKTTSIVATEPGKSKPSAAQVAKTRAKMQARRTAPTRSKTRPTVKPQTTSNRMADQRAKAQARAQAAKSRMQARMPARSRTRRAEGGMTDFKSIYDMEKKSGK